MSGQFVNSDFRKKEKFDRAALKIPRLALLPGCAYNRSGCAWADKFGFNGETTTNRKRKGRQTRSIEYKAVPGIFARIAASTTTLD